MFFQDPHTHAWHGLRWTGLPPEDEVPSFSDARVTDLLAAARQAGLRPRTDTELLPLLLNLLDAHVPLSAWPTMSKTRRGEHARQAHQGRAAATDQTTARPVKSVTASVPAPATGQRRRGGRAAGTVTPGTVTPGTVTPGTVTPGTVTPGTVTPATPSWPERARTVSDAVDGVRRRRREHAEGDRPSAAPGRLGDSFRRGNLFLIHDNDIHEHTDEHADGAS